MAQLILQHGVSCPQPDISTATPSARVKTQPAAHADLVTRCRLVLIVDNGTVCCANATRAEIAQALATSASCEATSRICRERLRTTEVKLIAHENKQLVRYARSFRASVDGQPMLQSRAGVMTARFAQNMYVMEAACVKALLHGQFAMCVVRCNLQQDVPQACSGVLARAVLWSQTCSRSVWASSRVVRCRS
jgi:hypothetical protein